jgi:GNAT superfamily N-acetyltransferase
MAREIVTSENRDEYIAKKMGLKNPSKKHKIEVKHDEKKNWLSAHHPAGQVGGKIKDKALHISHAELEEKERGKGYGKEMYKALIDHAHSKGLKVYSDSTVEMPAAHVYDSLGKTHYKVERLPGGGELEPDKDIPYGALYGKGANTPVFEVKPKG